MVMCLLSRVWYSPRWSPKNPLTYEIITPELVGVKSNSLPFENCLSPCLVEKLRELALDFTEEDIKPLFAKFKALADKKQEITDADIRALVAGTMVENQKVSTWMIWQLQTHADNEIEAPVSLANMDGEKVEFNATGQGSVDAIFNAIDKFLNQSVRCVLYHRCGNRWNRCPLVLWPVENRDTETIFNAAGLDFDIEGFAMFISSLIPLFKKRMQVMGHSVSLPRHA